MHPKLIFLIFLEYIKRKKMLLLGVFIFFIFIFFLNSKFNLFKSGENSISEGVIGTYQEHNIPEIITRLVSKSLVEIDKTSKPIPLLAEKWEVSSDATFFKFKLRENLRWSDGTSLKSSDLEFNMPDIEVAYPSDNEITFKLKDSFSPFPTLLTKPLFKKGTLLGTGPYKIKSIEKSRVFITKIKLEADKKLPNIVIRFYQNEKTAKVALKLGEIQSLVGISDLKQATSDNNLRIWQKTDYEKIVTILYNTKDPVLSSKNFRKALGYATPKIEGSEQAKTSISPHSWAFNNPEKDYIENEEAAKQALTRAKETVSPENLQKEIILTTVPQFEEIGKKIVESWQKLGLNAKLRIESGIPQNFQALLITQTIPQDPDQYSLWHSTQTQTNLSKYSSPRADKDLEDGRKTMIEEERKEKYADFQKVVLEDAPVTFLYYPKYNIIYLKKIEGNLNKILPLQIPD